MSNDFMTQNVARLDRAAERPASGQTGAQLPPANQEDVEQFKHSLAGQGGKEAAEERPLSPSSEKMPEFKPRGGTEANLPSEKMPQPKLHSDDIDKEKLGSRAPETLLSPGDLYAGRMSRETAPTVSTTVAGQDREAIVTLTDKLVDRILVSRADANNTEVRLTLNADALAETEIRLSRDATGALFVRLHSANPSSFQNLVAAQDGLRSALERTEQGSVRVEVSNGSEQEDGDARRRSRGYFTEEEQ